MNKNIYEVKLESKCKICCFMHRCNFLEKVFVDIPDYYLLLNTGSYYSMMKIKKLLTHAKNLSKPLDLITSNKPFSATQIEKFKDEILV